MKVWWTELALSDLHLTHDFIANENLKAAGQMIARIEDAVARLKHYPELGRAGRVKGTRELVIAATPFVVAYRVESANIEILAVLHGARKWPSVL